jgi:hypothetical protein
VSAGKHRFHPPVGRRKRAVVLGITAATLIMGPVGLAGAHNHAANPSGFCNQSGQGFSPGNSGETNLNPAGKPIGKANAGAGRSNCPTDPLP